MVQFFFWKQHACSSSSYSVVNLTLSQVDFLLVTLTVTPSTVRDSFEPSGSDLNTLIGPWSRGKNRGLSF